MFFKALILTAALECGFLQGGIFNYSVSNARWKDIGALYTSLDAKAYIGPAYVGGEMVSYFTPEAWNNYMPFQMTFVFQAGLSFDGVVLGYEHSCFHPMQPYATITANEIKPNYEGGFNKFFVRIETK